MKKYLVRYTVYDPHEWYHTDLETIIEAESKEAAKKQITDRSDMMHGDHYVHYIEEVEDETN